jgi:hypothetical protein
MYRQTVTDPFRNEASPSAEKDKQPSQRRDRKVLIAFSRRTTILNEVIETLSEDFLDLLAAD